MLTQEKYRSGDKMIFIQVHNLIPIVVAFLLTVVTILFAFQLAIKQRDAIQLQDERIKVYQEYGLESRKQILGHETRIEALENENLTPTPTKRPLPTPTPESN